jgi:salicylate hydroxylase
VLNFHQVEDGFALGRVFSHIKTRDQIPYLLHGYREVRHVRSMTTEASELGAFVFITLPPGPARSVRDKKLALSLVNPDDMSDDILAAAWDMYLDQFNYDANEAVDEWWLMAKFNMPQTDHAFKE